jgi:hypothetical protein
MFGSQSACDNIIALRVAPFGDREFGTTQRFEVAVDRYVHEQNLAHYRKVLSETNDPTKRQIVLKLLADELASGRPLTILRFGHQPIATS